MNTSPTMMNPISSQPRPIQPNGDNQWSPSRPADESMLSQSLGNAYLARRASLKRSTSEIASIYKTGYLLKRSNNPHPSMSTLPVDTTDDTAFVLEPQSKLVADMIGDRDGGPAVSQMPQHKMLDHTEEVTEEAAISPIERSLHMMASFFGQCTLNSSVEKRASPVEPPAKEAPLQSAAPPVTPPRPIGLRSAPISMQAMPILPFDDDSNNAVPMFLNRGDSAPSVMCNPAASGDGAPPPADFIDPHDGHKWHAKYCVLEDGILYFYRNANDGESQEAKAERMRSYHERTPNGTPDAEDLSMSPTPRKLLKEMTAKADSSVIWEKRVLLKCVGAVRSTDQEYGECSFELLAVDDEDEDEDGANLLSQRSSIASDNKLILRARNPEEMREWLFQFHRYLASMMKNIIETVGSSDGMMNPDQAMVPLGDIHHPSFAQTYVPPRPCDLGMLNRFSPGSYIKQHHAAHVPASLSHGHGQSALRRKRSCSKKGAIFSTPRGSPSQLPDQTSQLGPTPTVTPTPVVRAIRSEPSSPIGFPTPDLPPEVSRPPEICPETERPPPRPPNASKNGKYVAPHLRNRLQSDGQITQSSAPRYVPPAQRRQNAAAATGSSTPTCEFQKDASRLVSLSPTDNGVFEMSMDEPQDEKLEVVEDARPKIHRTDEPARKYSPLKLGGCADPRVVLGSILDPIFKPRSASTVGQVHTEDYGFVGGGKHTDSETEVALSLKWEIGAVSNCGVRSSNEDSYLVASNLSRAFDLLPENQNGADNGAPSWAESGTHHPGLFAVFDGHNGNHAARYAAEKLTHFLLKESRVERQTDQGDVQSHADSTAEILRKAVDSLDDAFCRVCTEDGRDWESGATALIALVAHEHLVLANLGDCRGIVCRSIDSSNYIALELHVGDEWTELDLQTEETTNLVSSCYFRELTDIHKPSRPDELERILKANGWITTDIDIPMDQVNRMDFCDEDVVRIVKRQTSQQVMPPEISRVCGDLAVSRALGDREYKAAFNEASPVEPLIDGTQSLSAIEWDSPMDFLDYPEKHNRRFKGDLVSPIPEIQRHKLAETGVFDEFLLLACDGLWDVMDPYDAIQVARRLLFDEKSTAKDTASRLAKLAIHLGSTDNITVIIVRFFKEEEDRSKP